MKTALWAMGAMMLALAGYVAAGPFLTIRAIERAAMENRTIAIARRVDFPQVRASLKIQFNDHLVRRAGPEAQAGLLGRIGLRVTGVAIDAAVDATVNPVGLASLMQGRKAYARLLGDPRTADAADAAAAEAAAANERPLADARYRYESPSRFTVTVTDETGRATVFVLTRRGLRWRLSDIRLPLARTELTALRADPAQPPLPA